MEKKYYIYIHTRIDKNEIFYVGLGTKNFRKNLKLHTPSQIYSRAFSKKRNNIWKKIVSKTNYKVDIIYEFETKKEAINKEIELIKLYGRIDQNSGILCNLTDGGEGTSNCTLELKNKRKILAREMHNKKIFGFYKKHSKESLYNIRYNRNNNKRVIQKDIENNFIREWNSLGEIGRELNIDTSSISKVCRKERNSAYNYKWQYV